MLGTSSAERRLSFQEDAIGLAANVTGVKHDVGLDYPHSESRFPIAQDPGEILRGAEKTTARSRRQHRPV